MSISESPSQLSGTTSTISVSVVLVAVTITIIILLFITVLYFKRKIKKKTNSKDGVRSTVNNSPPQSHSQEIRHGMDNIASGSGYKDTQIGPRLSIHQSEFVVDNDGVYEVIV